VIPVIMLGVELQVLAKVIVEVWVFSELVVTILTMAKLCEVYLFGKGCCPAKLQVSLLIARREEVGGIQL
jgi:hypothetical protein